MSNDQQNLWFDVYKHYMMNIAVVADIVKLLEADVKKSDIIDRE